MKNFQYIVLTIFVVVAVLAVLLFSGLLSRGGDGGAEEAKEVVMWGTLPYQEVSNALAEVGKNEKNLKVTYVQKTEARLEQNLVESLASGIGPDLVLINHELIYPQRDKYLVIPYETIPERTFRDFFVEGGELFLSKEGVIGFPIYVDPLVMYWNRGLFSSAGIALPPTSWAEFLVMVEDLTKRDDRNNILQSVVAMGGFDNIANAKEILATLILQTGNEIVANLPEAKVTLSNMEGPTTALRFYTEFSNPAKTTYSWNNSLPNSLDYFASDRLAVYFGFSSDLRAIQNLNPNLNLDVAPIPQIKDSNKKVSYGKIGAVVVLKSSKKPMSAFDAAYKLAFGDFPQFISSQGTISPARRDLIGAGTTDPLKSIFYREALTSKAWLDPDYKITEGLFRDMIEGVVVGRLSVTQAISRAGQALGALME